MLDYIIICLIWFIPFMMFLITLISVVRYIKNRIKKSNEKKHFLMPGTSVSNTATFSFNTTPTIRTSYILDGSWTTVTNTPITVKKPRKPRKPRTKKVNKVSVYKDVQRIIDVEAEI